MKRQWWFRVGKSAALLAGYFWYNGNIHLAIARILS